MYVACILAMLCNPVAVAFAPANVWVMRDAALSSSLSALWPMPVTLEEGGKHSAIFNYVWIAPFFSPYYTINS